MPHPASGSGPYRCLPQGERACTTPTVLVSDPTADFDDPVVFADGARLGLWMSARRGGHTRIEHADAENLDTGFGEPQVQLVADRSWEGEDVSAPSLVPGDPVVAGAPWILLYLASGAIGFGTSPDGHTWNKGPGPTLVADGAAEGTSLGPPAAVLLGDRVRVYYVAAGALWAAEAPLADLLALRAPAWTRLDGDPATPARDPMLAGAPYAASLGRAFARAALTPAGRVRHDLYFTANLPQKDFPTNVGFAASYTGDRFAVAPAPILAALPPAPRSPTATPYTDGTWLLLVTQRAGIHDGIAAAISP